MTQTTSSAAEISISTSIGGDDDSGNLGMSGAEDETPYTYIVLLGDGSGKSTIAGQLLVLHGRVDEEQMQEAKDASCDHGRPDSYLSYLMDTSEEERHQGRTLELGIERFESEGKRFMIFDTPAQKINRSDMFLGMFGADIAIVVLSALSTYKGIFESLLSEMVVQNSVSKIVIAINHMDHPDVMWSESIYKSIEEIVFLVFPFAVNQVNQDAVRVIPTSGLEGQNISTRVDNTLCPWWKGPCLLEVINSLQEIRLDDPECDEWRYFFDDYQATPEDCQPTRMPIFSKVENHITLENNIVFGRLASGILRVGDGVIIMPNQVEATVLRIYEDESLETQSNAIHVGTNAYVELTTSSTNINELSISTGSVLSSITNPISTRTLIPAYLSFSGVSFPDYCFLINQGIEDNFYHENRVFMLHMHTLAQECRIRRVKVARKYDYGDGKFGAHCLIEALQPISIEDEIIWGEGNAAAVTRRLSLVSLREKDGNMKAYGITDWRCMVAFT